MMCCSIAPSPSTSSDLLSHFAFRSTPAMDSRIIVKSLDHLVLTCNDVVATSIWYTKHLGMRAESFTSPTDPSVVRHALKFGEQKINLHQRGKEFLPNAATALPGTADLCFLVEDGTDLDEVIRGFHRDGLEVLEDSKVVARTGAQGPIRSVYVRDPDGNLIEYVYPLCDVDSISLTLPHTGYLITKYGRREDQLVTKRQRKGHSASERQAQARLPAGE